jgi:squalene-associated FAD-dependent desaturase
MAANKNNKIIIIGAGIAGISAAIHALDHNLKPILIDRNRHLGGRVRSFYSQDIAQYLDNGQHILAAAYSETRELLRKIGSHDKVHFQNSFEVDFIANSGKVYNFRTYPIFSPLHFLLPLLIRRSHTGILWRDFWNIILNAKLLKKEEFKQMTIQTWLNRCKQSKAISEFLWKPLALSILNTPIHSASAYLLYQAISKSFLGPRKMSGMGIPLDWLSHIFANPAEKYLKKADSEIFLLNQVQKIINNDDHTLKIVTQKRTISAAAIICAVPPFALSDILKNSTIPELGPLVAQVDQFEYNPIMTINIYLNKPLPGHFPAALVSSPIQWIFRHPVKDEASGQFGYALVSSAAAEYSESSREEILEMVYLELSRLYNIDLKKTYYIVAYKVIKEKRATISQTPESLLLRPTTKTALENFYLAGDWIDTGLPATIEGAALSGRLAIEMFVQNNPGL